MKQIQYRKLGDLKKLDSNPRKISNEKMYICHESVIKV